MIKPLNLVFFVLQGVLLLYATPSGATAVLDRPVLIHTSEQATSIWARYELFNQNMDLLHYQQHFNSTTKLDSYDRWAVGINQSTQDYGDWRASFFLSEQSVTRSLQPTQIKSQYQGLSLQWQYVVLETSTTASGIELGFSRQRSPNTFFDRYNPSPNATVIAAPGKHLINASAWSEQWQLGVRHRWQPTRHWTFNGGVVYRTMKIQSQMDSYDPAIRVSLRSPQNEPWRERQIMLNAELSWQPLVQWSGSVGWQHLSISRQQYRQISGNPDYQVQDIFDAYLYYQPTSTITLFLRGQASSHFLLGISPLTYNSRSSHRFNAPFATLAWGGRFKF
ncbi:MAG: hypothetical protein Q9M09_05385 [Mariprofundaceae bacterium]|nr:hypothetical protein [Mariprofundaceae bacterium]